MMRIEAARRIFPRCWFNEKTTEAGHDTLVYYHERKDENRNVGLGPERDYRPTQKCVAETVQASAV
jgi:phage terminase large subunit